MFRPLRGDPFEAAAKVLTFDRTADQVPLLSWIFMCLCDAQHQHPRRKTERLRRFACIFDFVLKSLFKRAIQRVS